MYWKSLMNDNLSHEHDTGVLIPQRWVESRMFKQVRDNVYALYLEMDDVLPTDREAPEVLREAVDYVLGLLEGVHYGMLRLSIVRVAQGWAIDCYNVELGTEGRISLPMPRHEVLGMIGAIFLLAV